MARHQYLVKRLIGRGGTSEVHDAVAVISEDFSRRVAIKRFIEAPKDVDVLATFVNEARILSRLHHGGIVSILDFGVVDERPFVVLELVDGMSAEVACRHAGGLPLEVALHIVTEVAHTLHYVHTAVDDAGSPLGIVHRDVKPSNILLSRSGDVKLTDFGIALGHERLAKTHASVVKGTAGYTSPEALRGDHVGPAADVFALGSVLFKLLTGEHALTVADELRLREGETVVLRESPKIPGDVAAIIQRALAPNPLHRFDSAAELATTLGRTLARVLEGDSRGVLLDALTPMLTRDTERGLAMDVGRALFELPQADRADELVMTLEGIGGRVRQFSGQPSPQTVTVDAIEDAPREAQPREKVASGLVGRSSRYRAAVFALALLATTTVGLTALAIVALRRGRLPPSSSIPAATNQPAPVEPSPTTTPPSPTEEPQVVDQPPSTSSAGSPHTSSRCWCIEARMLGRALCPKLMTPSCQCENGGPTHVLCPSLWTANGECPGGKFMVGKNYASGAPCIGHAYDIDGEPKNTVTRGTLSCDVCYGHIPPTDATPSVRCLGYRADGARVEGNWKCER